MVTTSQICSTEQDIIEYFKTVKLIDEKVGKLQLLHKQRIKTENDIKNTNITLISNMPGITYDKPNIQRNNTIVSFQEKAMEKAINILEKRLEDIDFEIMYIETLIMDLENKSYSIGNIIAKLREEEKELLKLIYIDKKSFEDIGYKLNMGKSTVSRKKENIIKDIAAWKASCR